MHPNEADTTREAVNRAAINQAAINRANAQHSTGPKTEEGKQRSRFNAFRHGLTGQTIVLPWEDREKYEALRAGLMDDLQPKGAYEEQLAQTIVDASWKLNRAAAAESNMFTHYLHEREGFVLTGDEEIDTALTIGHVYRTETAMLAGMALCCQRIERLRRNARVELETLQATRKTREAEEMADAAELRKAIATKRIPYNPAEDGFVFSAAEIDTYIGRMERRERAGLSFGRPLLRRMAA